MNQLLVLFAADYPDDSVWNERGDLELPGGREVAEELVAALARLGARCSDVCQRSFYGWEFAVDLNSSSAMAVLQQAEEWLLVLAARQSMSDMVTGKQTEIEGLRTIAENVKSALEADEHVSNIRVLTEVEYHNYIMRTRR